MQYGIISLLLYKKERIFEKFSEDDHGIKQVEEDSCKMTSVVEPSVSQPVL